MPVSLMPPSGSDRRPSINLPRLDTSDTGDGKLAPPTGGTQRKFSIAGSRGDDGLAARVLGNAITAGIVPGGSSDRKSSIFVGGGERRLTGIGGRSEGNRTSFAVDADTVRTISVNEDDFFRPKQNSIKPSRSVIVEIGGKKFDLTEAKRNVVRSQSAKLTRQFRVIYKSSQFDDLIVKASEYILWHLRAYHLERGKSLTNGTTSNSNTPALGTAPTTPGSIASGAINTFPSTPGAPPTPSTTPAIPTNSHAGSPSTPSTSNPTPTRSISVIQPTSNAPSRTRNVLFPEGIDPPDLPTARIERDIRFKDFGASYCFLLLFASSRCTEPARERSCFESIYAFTKEAVVNLLSLPAFSTQIDVELARVFRSGLFCGGGVKEERRFESTRSFSVTGKTTMKDGWMGALGSRPDSSSTRVSGSSATRSRPGSSRVGSARSGGRPSVSVKRGTQSGRGSMGRGSVVGGGFLRTSSMGKKGRSVVSAKSEDTEGESGGEGGDPMEPDVESQLMAVKKPTRRKRLSINDVRMARSPLADAVLPPPQRFLFVQTRAGTIGNLVGV
ncbi:hypothetical protein BC829DRAFT_406425 [Chytridium lagenaria]|nr:hypothetical protein BC829DRAFT_406425 [Chytridium lagenaria]